jgi:hypothetical protein
MPTPAHCELTERQRAWLEHLRACRAQGLSLKAYAERQGLNLQRFYHWNRRLKRLGLAATDAPVSFAAVRVSAARAVTGSQRLHFPNGLMLEWDGSADLALVEHLLRLSYPWR